MQVNFTQNMKEGWERLLTKIASTGQQQPRSGFKAQPPREPNKNTGDVCVRSVRVLPHE